MFLVFMAAGGVLAAILLARRNWKLGRIDRKGALRIGLARFILGMVVWLGKVHAVPSFDMLQPALAALANSLLWGVAFWLLYVALEPTVRAHWPHSIVTWNRIMGGRWRDAQVGSHILIGAAAGAAVWTTAALVDYFSKAGMMSASGIDAALGTRQWIGFHANTLAGGLGVGLLSFFALTGLRQLVKRDLVAAMIAAAYFTFVNGVAFNSPNWPAKTAVYLLIFSVLLLVLLRYGLVTIIAAVFFIDTLDSIGLGADWKAWYAPAGLATAALLLGIAVFAFSCAWGSSDVSPEAGAY